MIMIMMKVKINGHKQKLKILKLEKFLNYYYQSVFNEHNE